MVPLCAIKTNEEGLEEGECSVLDVSIEILRGIRMDVSRKLLDKWARSLQAIWVGDRNLEMPMYRWHKAREMNEAALGRSERRKGVQMAQRNLKM